MLEPKHRREDVRLERITVDKRLQSRASISDLAVGELSVALLTHDDWPFPPLDLFQVEGAGLVLVDGFLRFEAALATGWLAAPCRIFYGSWEAAAMYAAGANSKNAFRRTRADQKRSVELLLSFEGLRKLSLTELSRSAGVSLAVARQTYEEAKGREWSIRTPMGRGRPPGQGQKAEKKRSKKARKPRPHPPLHPELLDPYLGRAKAHLKLLVQELEALGFQAALEEPIRKVWIELTKGDVSS
jgi:hypothetical protein